MRAISQEMWLHVMTLEPDEEAWLGRFHAGERAVMQECYEEHFEAVSRAAGAVLRGADLENVVHDVFLRMIADSQFRRKFAGGSLRSWIKTVARNRAIDYARKYGREQTVEPGLAEALAGGTTDRVAERTEARDLLRRFRKEQVPPRWERVFEVRFVQQLSQRDAARSLGLRRTTLAYQESKLRERLRSFVLRTHRLGGAR